MRKPVIIRERPHTPEELAKLYGVPMKRLREIQQSVRDWIAEHPEEGPAKPVSPAKRVAGTRKKTTARRSA